MSAIESAPATMPATSADTFAPAAHARPARHRQMLGQPPEPGTLRQRHRRHQPGARHQTRIIEPAERTGSA